MRKISDDGVATIRALAANGAPQAELARRFGISQSAVSRLVAGERRPALDAADGGAVSAALEEFLATVTVEGADRVRAASARVLARTLDATAASATVAAASVMPRLAAELDATLAVLAAGKAQEASAARVLRMMAPVR